jgi:hypothetical protein
MGLALRARSHSSTSWDDYSALRNSKRADVRFGSKADIGLAAADVRFTPKSGHQRRQPSQGSHRCALDHPVNHLAPEPEIAPAVTAESTCDHP